MDVTNSTVQLNTSDGKMEAYVAQPKDGGTYPGIVVIQEAFGVNNHIKKVTERIAGEGYVAIAPDIFHREAERIIPYSEMPKAIATMQRVVDSKAMEDVGAAIAHLKSQSNVKSGSIGVIGFCMGGRLTYLAAAHHNKDVKCAVPFYGGGIPMGNPSPLSRTGEIKCPMYLFFGAKDPLIPLDQVNQIKAELTAKKVPFQMEIYPEPGHGFFCDDRGGYHEASAKDTWEKTKSFFAQHLK
ncbi:MAG TPA: dienelactone hydrolase family protein [Candidatus Binatia bacterium]|jgi:carboxymethylenebutenolidase|nr:dienelactone hydrolase family protein [Candidatus Binatia bacterium]